MINPFAVTAGVAAGVATGVVAEQTNNFIKDVILEEEIKFPSEKEMLHQIAKFTRLTAEALNTSLTKNQDIPLQIFPYPNVWMLPNHNRKHVSIFLPSGVTGTAGNYTPNLTTVKFYFEVFGAGLHVKTMTLGWNQLDVPIGTTISSADGNTYSIIVSLRDDPIGAAI